jgi:hypothetical protein
MCRLIGKPVSSPALHRRSHDRSARSISNTSMMAPRSPRAAQRSSSAAAASAEWSGRKPSIESRSGATWLNSSAAQSFQAAKHADCSAGSLIVNPMASGP